MAHKTLIGGTAYEISGGKTLINGTAYEIKNGKTLVGGTVYEVGFIPVITFQGNGAGSEQTYCEVDGVKYTSKTQTSIKVPIGTTITCVAIKPSGVTNSAMIVVNGTIVAKSQGGNYFETVSYEYIVKCSATIDILGQTAAGNGQIKIIED